MSAWIAEDHSANIYLEHFDGVPDELWTDPGQYGDSRRKRLRPTSIQVVWTRSQTRTLGEWWGEWSITRLAVYGRYLRQGSDTTMLCVLYQDGKRSLRKAEPWIEGLLATVIDLTNHLPAPLAKSLT